MLETTAGITEFERAIIRMCAGVHSADVPKLLAMFGYVVQKDGSISYQPPQRRGKQTQMATVLKRKRNWVAPISLM